MGLQTEKPEQNSEAGRVRRGHGSGIQELHNESADVSPRWHELSIYTDPTLVLNLDIATEGLSF
jgi:hypothetical protein